MFKAHGEPEQDESTPAAERTKLGKSAICLVVSLCWLASAGAYGAEFRASTRRLVLASTTTSSEDIILSNTIFVSSYKKSSDQPSESGNVTRQQNKTIEQHQKIAGANHVVEYEDQQTDHISKFGNNGTIHKIKKKKPFQSAAQYEGIADQRETDSILFQRTNRTSLQADQNQPNETTSLDKAFLDLFDELWQIKNSSITTLLLFDYFPKQISNTNNSDNNSSSSVQCLPGDRCAQEPYGTHVVHPQFVVGAHIGGASTRMKNSIAFERKQLAPPNSSISHLTARLGEWISATQARLQQMLKRFGAIFIKDRPMALKLNTARQQQSSSSYNNRDASINEIVDSLAGSSSQRTKRQANYGQLQANIQPRLERDHQDQQANCANLTIDELDRCKSSEQSINALLNQSFPGTMALIEQNCRQATFLLANCWPHQLAQLRHSLTSWNETLVMSAEFPLPLINTTDGKQSSFKYEAQSCGSGEPQSGQVIRDRVSWMWLNLCMDKKFRLDYVNNLRCLSSWSQERAQHVCNNEYKQMHGYLAHQAEINAAAASAAVAAATSSSSQPVPTQLVPAWQASNFGFAATGLQQTMWKPNNGNEAQDLEQMESREIGSKMLCCMFDQFLRCVHRQASRDCGRPGAQFVVNFMSRIGTDDMKYLCNGESRSTVQTSTPGTTTSSSITGHQYHQQFVSGIGSNNLRGMKTQSSNRKGQHHSNYHDRSPFIDGNYCTDSRIQNALQNVSAQYGETTRSRHTPTGVTNFGSKSANSMRTKTRTQINSDPTFWEGDSSALASRAIDLKDLSSTLLLVSLVMLCNVLNRFM